MNVLMAAMLWNLVPSTMLEQIMVLAAAALWFFIQSVARPEFTALHVCGQSRLRCLYHSLAMASAALMVAMMGHVTAAGPGTAPTGGMSMPGMSMPDADHTVAAAAQSTAAATLSGPSGLAIPLTVLFGVAAVVFIVLLLRIRATKSADRSEPSPGLSARAGHAVEALGAAAMALMFATMAA
jgi:hypothetical protein